MRVALLVTVLALALPTAATASTDVAVIGDTLFVSSEDTALFSGLSFNPVPNRYTVDDDNGDISAGMGCAQHAASPPTFPHKYVTCANNGIFHLVAALGAGKDLFQIDPTIQIDMVGVGEEGDDNLSGGLADDTLEGDSGDDQLDGNGGDDTLSDGRPEDSITGGAGGDDSFIGGPGDDMLDGGRFASVVDQGSGADTLAGGTGDDTADYSKRGKPLTITEDGQANDGQQVGAGSEGDNVVEVETILAGSAGDRLTGGPEASVLRGNAGGDVLDGGPGADMLLGESGTDTTSYATRSARVIVTLDELGNDGEAGEADDAETENATGGAGGDSLTGSSGANVLRGGAGGDTISALGGDDTIQARDGVKDVVKCGTGVDRATVDKIDSVAADCEKVFGKGKKPVPRLKIGATAVLKNGRLRVKVTSPVACAGGKVTVRSGTQKVGSHGLSLQAGKQRAIRVKVGTALSGRKRARAAASCPGTRGASRKVKITRPG